MECFPETFLIAYNGVMKPVWTKNLFLNKTLLSTCLFALVLLTVIVVKVQEYSEAGQSDRQEQGNSRQIPQDSVLPQAVLWLEGKKYWLAVANTPESAARGLMYKRFLPSRTGMAFPFSQPRVVSFWMMNTLIPLDILFFRQKKLVYMIESMKPCTLPSGKCPHYSSVVKTDLAIELPAHTIQDEQIHLGAIADITFCEKLK